MSAIKPMSNPALIYNFLTKIFPLVKSELAKWKDFAETAAEPRLAEQAIDSINTKGFHCQGGSIYALYPGVNPALAVEFIVAYQTISDYLDNLVDSLGVQDEKAFAQLHLAMQEALDPEVRTSDYYLYYSYKIDGGYLRTLVKTCQARVADLPAYPLVKNDLRWLAGRYSELQTYKHLSLAEREEKMLDWANTFLPDYPEISPWEFAAATGSTLAIFCLVAASSDPDLSPEEVKRIRYVYFPWICGLHILLDYFIDLVEDKETKQLNFVQYYENPAQTWERLNLFRTSSMTATLSLTYANFHQAVVKGLLAMYLSDCKSSLPEINPTTKQLLQDSGKAVKTLHWICSCLRKRNII